MVTLVAHSNCFSKWSVSIDLSLRKSLVKLIFTVIQSCLNVIEWISLDFVIGTPFSSLIASRAYFTWASFSSLDELNYLILIELN